MAPSPAGHGAAALPRDRLRRPGARGRRLTSAVVGTAGISLLVGAWHAIGPRHPAFALVVSMLSFGLVPFVGDALAPRVPRWLREAPQRERVLHRALFVPQIGRALDAIGWNAFVGRPRGAGGTREALRGIERSTRGNLAAHGTGLAVHLLAAIASAVAGAPGVAALVLATAVPLHLYPILIQRAVRLRLARVLARL